MSCTYKGRNDRSPVHFRAHLDTRLIMCRCIFHVTIGPPYALFATGSIYFYLPAHVAKCEWASWKSSALLIRVGIAVKTDSLHLELRGLHIASRKSLWCYARGRSVAGFGECQDVRLVIADRKIQSNVSSLAPPTPRIEMSCLRIADDLTIADHRRQDSK